MGALEIGDGFQCVELSFKLDTVCVYGFLKLRVGVCFDQRFKILKILKMLSQRIDTLKDASCLRMRALKLCRALWRLPYLGMLKMLVELGETCATTGNVKDGLRLPGVSVSMLRAFPRDATWVFRNP